VTQPLKSEERATKAAPAGAGNVVPLWFWAAAAVLFFFMVLEVWDARMLREEMRTVNEHANAEMQKRQQLQQEVALLRREQNILSDPTSVKIPLTGQNAQLPKMQATWNNELGIILCGQMIPTLADGRVLQLWLIPKSAGTKPVPSVTGRLDADGQFFLIAPNPPEALRETQALVITEEPAGGSEKPTTAPKWIGEIR
jgi:hypothetical protein